VHARVPIGLIGLIAGLVLAVGPAAWWGYEEAVAARAATAPLGPAPQVPQAPLRNPVQVVYPAAVRAADAEFNGPAFAVPEPEPAPASAPPVRIRVPDAGVDAPVVAAGVDAHGGMDVPLDVRTIGWYRFGPGPGSAGGSAVLAGHVDDRDQGPGAFYRLRELAAGSPVEVTLADGKVVTYRVGTVERMAKGALPAGQLFARDGAPRLALITCGGDFDRATGGYTDNVVVTAEPDEQP
jgi:sortase family protein